MAQTQSNLILDQQPLPSIGQIGTKNKKQNSSLLRHSQMALAEELHRRHLLTQLVMLIIVISALYSFIFEGLDIKHLFRDSAPIFALLLIGVISLAIVWLVHESGCLWEQFGVTTKGWQRAVKESLLFTAGLIIASIGLKWLFLTLTGDHEAVISPMENFTLTPHSLNLLPMALVVGYGIFCPLQELVTRGVFQTILQRSLTGTPGRRFWLGLLLSNLGFAQLHTHISIDFALVTFFLGLGWGWLYSRHNNLVGVSISHIIFGVWGQFILGAAFLTH